MKYKKTLVSLILPLILNSVGQAGTSSQADNKDTADSAIRRIDFLNFTYHPSVCAKEFGREGIGKTVRVQKGEFKNEEIYYGVVDNKVLYGDLTQDGTEEAVVHIGCGYFSANYGLSEVFVFTPSRQKAHQLAALDEKDFLRDYQRSYPNGSLWFNKSVKVVGGDLVVEQYAEGAHCCPEYIATIRYRWNGTSLVRVGKIERKIFSKGQ